MSTTEQEQVILQLEQQYADYQNTLLLPDLRVEKIEGIAKKLSQSSY